MSINPKISSCSGGTGNKRYKKVEKMKGKAAQEVIKDTEETVKIICS